MKNQVQRVKELDLERERFERWMRKHCDGADLTQQYGPTQISIAREPDGLQTEYTPRIYTDPEIQNAWEEWLRSPPKGAIELTAMQIWGWGILGATALAVVVVLIAKHFGYD